MNEALRLMQEEGFNNADIVFITDGECLLPEEYISNLQKEQSVLPLYDHGHPAGSGEQRHGF